jgi:Uncharacterized alpha/beta hydrolase domain (DUF2235)
MANDKLTAAAAANKDVSDTKPGPFQDCRDVVHIAVFFDGTGNNRKEDEATRKWSNVARMFEAAILDPKKATYSVYISGVGTPYNGEPLKWLSNAGVWIQDNVQGMGFGGGGDRRQEQGTDAVNDRLRDILLSNAQSMGGKVGAYAKENSDKSFGDVNTVLGKHRLIKIINLSIFGFSRGAALARAFSNRMLDACEKDGTELKYQGYPLRLNFLGIFDTVASVGLMTQNMRTPWTERELIVSPKVERCVHYVAAHEVRFSFPVDLIRKNGKLAGNWLEKTYPGVHSDVGGGYKPENKDKDGKVTLADQNINNNYARIPMQDMMREAVMTGVRMDSYDQIRVLSSQLFKKFFELDVATETAYKSYMKTCGPIGGTIENQMQQHMKALYSAYGTMHRTGMETPGDRRRGENWTKYIGPKGMAWEIDKYRAAAKAGKWVRIGDMYAQYVKPEDWQISAWDTRAHNDLVSFVATFVHDSKVDFLNNMAEPFSYFKARGVEESTISIWQASGTWITGKVNAAGEAVESGYNTTKKQVTKAADATAKAATETAAEAKKKAQEAADLAKRKGNEGLDYAGKKIDAAQDGAERMYEKGMHWIKTTASDAAENASKTYQGAKKGLGIN